MSTLKGRAAIVALWVLPAWLVRWFPPSFHETIEREVYDGMTRSEWFAEQVRQFQAAQAAQAPSEAKRG